MKPQNALKLEILVAERVFFSYIPKKYWL